MAELKVHGKETYNEEDNFSSKMEGQRVQCREKIILSKRGREFCTYLSHSFSKLELIGMGRD